ncbi:MAG: hypothetical protein IKR18_08120 [Bacteroidaceae bacterium]|nr:hypothetical protein [Bacteroidaceae bacterium]
MKLSNFLILLVLLLVVMYVYHYRTTRSTDVAVNLKGADTTFVDKRDTLPVSKRYERRRTTVREWHEGDLGGSQDVSHQVPTDYNGYSNNWDEELHNIGK